MPIIVPMQPEQVEETRRMIYTVAHKIFNHGDTLEDTIRIYQDRWPLHDLEDFEAKYLHNGGTFLVMLDEGRIIGSGAFCRMEEGVCEIKRLWFLPEYHGKGLGYQMMTTLLELARQRGYKIARLETSPAYQPRAFAFYQRLGFYEIPRYGDDLDDIGMEMPLV